MGLAGFLSGCGRLGSAPACDPRLVARLRVLPPAQPRTAFQVTCGDKVPSKKSNSGKKQRPKGAAGAGAAPPAPPQPAPQPARVTQNSLIPVRQQISYVKAFKEFEKKALTPSYVKPTKSFRRESITSEEHREVRRRKHEEAAALSKRESKNFALNSLYGSDRGGRTSQPKVLLVDGYNVLHKLREQDAATGALDWESAREALVELLTMYSHTNRVRVIVAFDAMGGSCCATSEELLTTGITLAFCGDQEADTYIESQVDFFLEKNYSWIIVATSDNLHRDVVTSKSGKPHQKVATVSSTALLDDIKRTRAELGRTLDAQRPSMSLFGSAIKAKNTDAFQELQRLRLDMWSGKR